MDVICLEEDAFYKLVDTVVERIKKEQGIDEDEWVNDERAMQILGCRKTKLQELRDFDEIVYSKPSKKWIMYQTTSLYNYLENHKNV